MRQILFLFLVFVTLVFLSACSSKSSFMKQDSLQAQGNYLQAVAYAKDHIDYNDPTDKNNLLWELYLGQSQYFDNNLSASISTFSQAESLMKVYREELLAMTIANDIGSILTNDNTRPYIGTTYDGIMLNTYKALAYLQEKDYSGARVEFNRALDRQRRAKEFFAATIEKEKQALLKEQSQDKKSNTSTSEKENTINQVVQANYPELSRYKLYPEFVNPTTNYLAALFALANNDTAKAEFLLKESQAMLPENKTIKDDYANLSTPQKESTVWVIYEEGLAPVLNEMRLDFPAWIFTSEVNYVSIALPRLHERSGSFNYLSLRCEDENVTQTELLSSMDRVIQTEFKMNYPSIVMRSVMSAISKAVMQNIANNTDGNIGALASFATTVYSILSTQADTRIWTSLPKNFHVAKFAKGQKDSVDIYSPFNYKIATVKLSDAQYSLIYVKIPTLAHKVHITSFPLGEK